MRDKDMNDLLFIATSIGFFALAIAYVRGCEKLSRRQP